MGKKHNTSAGTTVTASEPVVTTTVTEAAATSAAVSDNASAAALKEGFRISASPHIRSRNSTTSIMGDVIIALLPASAMGIFNFGVRAALMILVCVVSCMVFEYLSELVMKRRNTVRDLSAAVTGLLIALNLPVSLPFWMAILGCCFAIVVVKQLFGGIGQNFMNPALAARCFLVMSFVGPMTHFTLDAVTTATPLAVLREQGLGAVSVWDMFLGTEAGTIGETSVAALLIGAAYLLIRRVIKLTIPFYYLATFAICLTVYCLTKEMSAWNTLRFVAGHVCGGGLVLGAFFMATDYTTSPITGKGRVLYGILLGVLTFCFRIYGNSAEGVSFAIIISNLLVPMIEMVTRPKAFGAGYEKKSLSENRGWLDPVVLDEDGNVVPQKEDKKEKPLRIVVTICLIAVISGGLLGAVYAITKEPIEATAERKKQESFKAVMPEGDRYLDASEDPEAKKTDTEKDTVEYLNERLAEQGFTGVTLESRTLAYAGDEQVGDIWIITTHEGYAGDIQMAVGVKDHQVNGVSMLSIGETTGLGMEARDNPAFTEQYKGKTVKEFSVVKTAPADDSQIQAITGATITSKAVTNAVNAVLAADQIVNPGGGVRYE